MYSEEDYCCPECKTPALECSINGEWGYICPNCDTEFSTPDI